MSASVRAAQPSRASAPAAWSADPVEYRPCPWCRAVLSPGARKCAACGEWVVRTSAGPAPALLRLLGWAWLGVSVLGAAGVWAGGRALRMWLLVRAVDPAITPFVLDTATYGLAGLVLLQGVTVAVGLSVLAGMAPKRPRWWT